LATRTIIKEGTYRDSIALMKVSNEVSKFKGVSQAAVVMATTLNKRFLVEAGFKEGGIEKAGPDDLVIAIEAESKEVIESAASKVEEILSSTEHPEGESIHPKTLSSALRKTPDANLALISVPGRFAKREAMNAIEGGLDVFLFSSNVPREDELELKEAAKARNLLVMGPDCGTSIIRGTVLGFGNVVRQGSIGIVSASGTGIQQVSTLIHAGGLGISNAIGTGGNDLSEKVGGITTIEGIRLLQDDEDTKVIVVISKPPSPRTSAKVLRAVRRSRKPVIINFLGGDAHDKGTNTKAKTLEDAANIASALIRRRKPDAHPFSNPEGGVKTLALSESSRLSNTQKYIRGLYSGGTLCYEAQVVLTPLVGEVFSNTPLRPRNEIDANTSKENTCIDMGSDEFVVGRPHPMIDYSLRRNRIVREASDAETAVILLDVVLGYGSNPNPAGELASAVVSAKKLARGAKRYLSVVASLIGTSEDPQDIHEQAKTLSSAGVVLMPSNAQAARFAALVASRGAARGELFQDGG